MHLIYGIVLGGVLSYHQKETAHAKSAAQHSVHPTGGIPTAKRS
jgi:hypothetical protein